MTDQTLTTRLVIRSTTSQWRVMLRVSDDLSTGSVTLGDTLLATFARNRPVAMFGMYAAVTSLQRLMAHRLREGLTIETNKEGLSELAAVGLLPETMGV